MRLYTFINYYLSSIQQGIQSGHILGEIVNKNRFLNALEPVPTMTRDFLAEHKTFVVCNGGATDDIHNLIDFFENEENVYPWAYFNEDSASLDGIVTGVGIILPAEIYEFKSEFKMDPVTKIRNKIYTRVRYDSDGNVTWPEILDNPESYKYQLVDRIKSAPLAR